MSLIFSDMEELTIQELVEAWSTPVRPAAPLEHPKSDLELEWPPDRVKSFVTSYLRESCQWAIKRREDIEFYNKDARIKGVSYKDRKKYSVQIQALNELFIKWRERGIKYSRQDMNINDFIRNEGDLELIHKLGVEHQIKSMLVY